MFAGGVSPQSPHLLFDQAQPQNASASNARSDQENQTHSGQNYGHTYYGDEPNIKEEGADTAREQYSANEEQEDHGHGFVS